MSEDTLKDPIETSENEGGAGNLTTSAYLNSFKSVAPHVKSTGLRTAQLKFNSFSESVAQQDIASDYLVNSTYRRGDKEFDLSVKSFFDDACMTMVSQLDKRCTGKGQIKPLPAPLPLPMALHEAIAKRRSIRESSGDSLELDSLATILQCAGGVTARATVELDNGEQCEMPLRSVPSGGALYPIDIYVGAKNVSNLDAGLYRFQNNDNSLLSVLNSDLDDVNKLYASLPKTSFNVDNTSAVLVLVMRPWRSKRKYGARGLRFALLEAGYISQNAHLAATALGVNSCDFGGFYDNEVNSIFSIDGVNEAAIHLIFFGN